ncbi:MAG: DsbA family protein [Clostridiales Family XIII bacterium]|jgi:predicted DsbA family dithiol-disulfide isomerase|nr:DsbA family protein [Clostridiales Family XIII bacterium]
MRKLVFFYDYICPYCKKGYGYLNDVIAGHDDIEIEWRPVESHPRPEELHPHTDLCIEAYYSADASGAATTGFHDKLFETVCVERQNVEEVDVLVSALEGIVPADTLRADLDSGKYKKNVGENNILAFEKSGVWAVPAFRMDGERLDAVEGIGVTPEQVAEFLAAK